MRILHVSPNYYPALGGSDFHIKEISERLAARGHDVAVLTLREWSAEQGNIKRSHPPEELESINAVAVRRVRPNLRFHHCFNRFLKVRGSYRMLGMLMSADRVQMLSTTPVSLAALRHMMRGGIDIVGVINWYHSTLAYQCCLAKTINRIPLVGIPLFHLEREWSRSQIFPEMLARCDAVLANTDYERRHIQRRVPQHQGVHAVGVGIDPAAFSNVDGTRIRKRHGLGNAPVVGYVGRIAANKGLVKLIEAMKIVWGVQSQARLVLAGSGFPPAASDPEITKALNGLSPDENRRVIRISAFSQEEKPSIFAAFDVFAMPSVAESFGIAYLEAWMCSKPVIGARIGSTQEVIRDGVDGLLVSPSEPHDIARAILELLADRDKRDKMGQRGYSKTIGQFTWDKVTDKVETIYRELLPAADESVRSKQNRQTPCPEPGTLKRVVH